MVQNRINEKSSLWDKISALCFCLIALNLLWAFFANSLFGSLFSAACMGLFSLMIIKMWGNAEQRISSATAGVFAALIIWALIMIPAYINFNTNFTQTKFLFIETNVYAVFCMRVLVAILPSIAFSNRYTVKMEKWFRVIIFVVLVVSFIYTVRAVTIDPNSLRQRSALAGSVMTDQSLFDDRIKHAPSYAMIYSYALLMPWFMHKCCMTTNKIKTFYVICTLFLMYIIIVAQFATALVLALVGILIYLFIVSNNKMRMLVVISGLAIWCLIALLDGGADIFYWFANQVSGSWAEKLRDIASVLSREGTETSVSDRADLYGKSLTAFTQSPIIGKFWRTTDEIGGHATAIDVLGMAGLLGFVPFVSSISSNFARMKSFATHIETRAIAIACSIQFVALVFLKNIITSMAIFFTFFAFIPLLVRSEEKEMGEKQDGSNQNDTVQRYHPYVRVRNDRAQ